MNRQAVFASRNVKELLRDPINFGFGLGFPLVILLLLTAIHSHAPVPIFTLDRLTPGIVVFGFSFISLFSATLISKDRTSSFLLRLYASPLRSSDFILAYTIPMIPMAILQAFVCFAGALALGLKPTVHIFGCIAVLMPAAILYIAIGLLCGAVFNDKQVGGLCGALLTNLTAWLSDTWFDLSLVGGAFETFAGLLPFSHSVEAARAALAGDYAAVFPDLWWVIGYAAVTLVGAVLVFRRKMSTDAR